MGTAVIIDLADPTAIDLVVAALGRGEPVVIPTDTVYGLIADPTNAAATAGLFERKQRRFDTPMAVLVADGEQSAAVLALDDRYAALMSLWPGALTLVGRRTSGVDLHLGGDPTTVGVRCPDHPWVRELCRRVGPIAATSANRHGEPTPFEAAAVADQLGDDLLIIDGGPATDRASTVVDVTGPEPTVLREGPLSAAELTAALSHPAPKSGETA